MTDDERQTKLALARVELAEAERLCRLLGHAVVDPEAPADFAARLDVEVAVAARRLELWQAVVDQQLTPADDRENTDDDHPPCGLCGHRWGRHFGSGRGCAECVERYLPAQHCPGYAL